VSDDHTHEHQIEIFQNDVHIVVPIRDEFLGDIRMTISLSPGDAVKVRDMAPSVARLYLGHGNGPLIQAALRKALA
jgi:hypothetical protein